MFAVFCKVKPEVSLNSASFSCVDLAALKLGEEDRLGAESRSGPGLWDYITRHSPCSSSVLSSEPSEPEPPQMGDEQKSPDGVRYFRLSEIEEQNSFKSTWIIIHNKVYDVTKFLEEVWTSLVLCPAGSGDRKSQKLLSLELNVFNLHAQSEQGRHQEPSLWGPLTIIYNKF